MIYFKKIIQNKGIYRSFNVDTFTVVSVVDNAVKCVIRTDNEGEYNQIYTSTLESSFEESNEQEFNDAKQNVITIINT